MFAAPLLLTACFSEEKTGAVDVQFDRDSCELCRMLISDPRFVAEVRGGPKLKVWKFDDLGDALHWLNKQPWKNDKTTEVWVADMNSQKNINWLDATKAYYIDGQMTPMNHGYGAVSEKSGKTVDYKTMMQSILGKGNNLLCETPLNGESAGMTHGSEGHTQEDHARHMQDPNHQHDPAHNHPENHK